MKSCTKYNRLSGGLPEKFLIACLLVSPASLFAADASGGSAWEYTVSARLWGSSIDSTTPSGSGSTIDFDKLIKNLEMAFMGGFAARNDRWSVGFDLIYVDAKKSANKPIGNIEGIGLTRGGSLELESWIFAPYVGYVLHASDQGRFEVLGGLRYLDLQGTLTADISVPSQPIWQFRKKWSETNWDAIIGLQGWVNLSSRWFLPLYVDVGTGDSDSTWQAFAGLGYRFSKVNLMGGYRYLDYNFDAKPDSLMAEMSIGGPVLVVNFQF